MRCAELLAALLMAAGPVLACELKVESAWIRLPPPGAVTAAGYATLRNPGAQPLTIVGVHSPSAAMAHLHESVVKDGMAQMHLLERLTIAAHGRAELSPAGKHVMLMQPSALHLGDQVPVAFTAAGGCVTEARFEVRASAPPAPAPSAGARP